jgi:hypothetical protein
MKIRKKHIYFIIIISAIIGALLYIFWFKKNKQAVENIEISKPLNPYYLLKYGVDINDIKTSENSVPQADNNLDSNKDGISDQEAINQGLNPHTTDNDSDGIFDVDELNITKTNPLNSDTDGDGHSDLEEIQNGYNPNGEGKLPKQ